MYFPSSVKSLGCCDAGNADPTIFLDKLQYSSGFKEIRVWDESRFKSDFHVVGSSDSESNPEEDHNNKKSSISARLDESKSRECTNSNSALPPSSSSSSLDRLKDILAMSGRFMFHSMDKTCDCSGKTPAPVDVRDSKGRSLFKFVSVKDMEKAKGQSRHHFVLIDSQGRILLAASPKSIAPRPAYCLCTSKGPLDFLIFQPTQCSTSFDYEVLEVSWPTGEIGPPLLKCEELEYKKKSSIVFFSMGVENLTASNATRIGEIREVGDMKRVKTASTSTSSPPPQSDVEKEQRSFGVSQVDFRPYLPLTYKIMILFIGWHIHVRNFAETSLGGYGSRGAKKCTIITISIILGFILLFGVVGVIIYLVLRQI